MDLKSLRQIAEEARNEIVTLRRQFHEHPELSWQEEETLARIKQWVNRQNLGRALELHEGRGGIWFDLVVKPGESFVVFRADVDALPLQEEAKVPFASVNPGVMHACGHDAHTAMLMVAMRTLAVLHYSGVTPGSIKNNIRFVFQRAEEDYTSEQGSGGKVMVNDDGVCEGVKAAFALHVFGQLPSGLFRTRPKQFMVNSDRAELTIETKGGHAGYPERSSNALDFATDIVNLARTLPGRLVAHADGPAILVSTVCHAGSDLKGANVVPNRATVCWSIRTGTEKAKKAMKDGLDKLCGDLLVCRVMRHKLTWIDGHPATVNSPEMVEWTSRILKTVDLNVKTDHEVIPGGEDFSHIAAKVPSAYWMLGAGGEEGGQVHHNAKFELDEEVLPLGVLFWLLLAAHQI